MATTTEEFGSLGGIGLSVLLGATQIGVMAHGAKYSMGMELVTGASNTPAFMSASTPGHQLGHRVAPHAGVAAVEARRRWRRGRYRLRHL